MSPKSNPDMSKDIRLLEDLFEYIIPKYLEAHDIMISMLDFPVTEDIRVADLGCGFGELSGRLLEMLPTATVFGLDKEKRILKRAKEKLGRFGDRFKGLQCNLNLSAWAAGLSPLNAVVSSFTLDYLTPDRHREIISDIYGALNHGGRFVSCEFFIPADEHVSTVFHDLEIRYIQSSLQRGEVTKEQIDLLSQSTILRQKHHICRVDTKIEWLHSAGFKRIDVPWRFLNLAVVSAVR